MTQQEFAERLAALIDEGNREGMVAVAKDTPDGDVWLMVGYKQFDRFEPDIFCADITP